MSLGKGIKAFGDRAVDATTKEFSQLYEKGVLIPKHFNELSKEERDEVLPVVVFIKEKRSADVRGPHLPPSRHPTRSRYGDDE